MTHPPPLQDSDEDWGRARVIPDHPRDSAYVLPTCSGDAPCSPSCPGSSWQDPGGCFPSLVPLLPHSPTDLAAAPMLEKPLFSLGPL